VEKFESLRAAEQQYFVDMVKHCKDAGERVWCVPVEEQEQTTGQVKVVGTGKEHALPDPCSEGRIMRTCVFLRLVVVAVSTNV